MIDAPHRVLFVSKYADLNATIKSAFYDEFSHDEIELVCYDSLDDYDRGYYINWDLVFAELGAVIHSDFLHKNKVHHNWEFLKLVLLVDKNSSQNLSELFEKLQEEDLKMVLDYITIDCYSNKLISLSCCNYCKNFLHLSGTQQNILTTN